MPVLRSAPCRDIKPENILLAPVGDSSGSGPCSWRLKVIDYGCSAFCIPGQKLHEAVGTVSSRAVASWLVHGAWLRLDALA